MRRKKWQIAGALSVVASVVAAVVILLRSRDPFPDHLRCRDSKPDVIEGRLTGYATCGNGATHRPTRSTCSSFLPRSEEVVSREERRRREFSEEVRHLLPALKPLDPSLDECRFDSDCKRAPHGHCVELVSRRQPTCQYGCVRDSECPQGICVCGYPIGRCVRAWCEVDSDCAAPAICTTYPQSPGCWREYGFACQKPVDECTVDSDCDGGTCGWDGSKRVRVCTPDGCPHD